MSFFSVSEPISRVLFPSAFKQKIKDVCYRISIHTDLISSIFILALDAIFLMGKICSAIPEKVTQLSFIALNLSGLIALNFMVSLLKKTFVDSCVAKKAQAKGVFLK